MSQDLRIYIETDGGGGVQGWTVTRRVARKTGAPGAIQDTTSTDVNGMAEFLGVDSDTGPWDIYATNGTAVREWRGYTSPPISTTNLALTRNALVNGDFTVWQGGTSFVAPATTTYTADRWQQQFIGTAVWTIARDTSVPAVASTAINTPYSIKMTIPTTADAAIAAGDLYRIHQVVEGFDYRSLTNGFSLSFWVKAHRTGTYCVSFINSGVNRSYVAEYTIAVGEADTWVYKTVVVTTPPTAGTWDYSTGIGLYVSFAIAAGSTFQTTANTWQVGQFLATSNQVNGVGATTDVFSLALVNLTPGTAAQVLQPVSITDQVQRCQRYRQVFGGDATAEKVGSGYAVLSTSALIHVPFAVTMRGIPTLTVSAVGDWVVNAAAGAAVCTSVALTASASSTRAAAVSAGVASGLTAGQGASLSANGTANARLTFESNPA